MRTILLTAAALSSAALAGAPAKAPDLKALEKANAAFKPVPLAVDVSKLPANEQQALAKILEAGQVMDALFLDQVWAGNEGLLMRLSEDTSPLGRARLEAFLINKGPWFRLEHDQAFLPGVPEKPAQANFYSADAKQEVEQWVAGLTGADKANATGFFYTVRRAADGRFQAVPYSVEYQGQLRLAAQKLREAAALTAQPTLKKFLESRAAAFLSNDYYPSDVDWMKLDASIEPTIGPYEVYEDGWFNQKAGFTSFICLRDDAETAQLQKFSAQLQDVEDHLPIDPKYRNPKLGALAPIRVVNELYASGDASHGVQTAAFNLPNDERIQHEMGTKRVMLRNVQEAKFHSVLEPISRVALSPADQKKIAFEAFFTHILMHELMHGLGPHTVVVNGKPTTVRQQFQEAYSATEEAKADISGLWAMQYLIDKGVIAKAMEPQMYATYLASAFRSIRFGTNEAHGKGIALQLNYLMDKGAVVVKPNGTFAVVDGKIKDAVKDLTHDLMTLQAQGDVEGARAMLARLGVVRPPVQKVLDRLGKVPVDIRPRYVTAEKVLAGAAK